MNLGAPRVGVTRGSSPFSALPLADGINHDQPRAGGPDLGRTGRMNLGAPRVGVTRGSSLFSALPLADGINHDQRRAGGPDLARTGRMNLGAPRVGVTRGSSLFSALPLVDGINRDQPSLPFLVRKKTTPHPCAWILHQTALHGIGMHVLQLFSYFVTAVHVEVIKAWLPETRQSQTIVQEGQP